MDIQELITQYKLTPHPEGGYYRELYRSSQSVTSPVHGKVRSALTHIYFMLPKGEISRFHRVEHDEIWNYYDGEPIRLVLFDGEVVTEQVIGKGCDDFTVIVPAGVWQAAEPVGEYSIVGCSVAPGFDFEDFCFMNDEISGVIEKLFPDYCRFV